MDAIRGFGLAASGEGRWRNQKVIRQQQPALGFDPATYHATGKRVHNLPVTIDERL